MPANATTRHAVVRSIGSTTLAQKQEDGSWSLVCLNHRSENPQPSRGLVWKAAAHPEAWCPKCKTIAAGKAEKITDGLLTIPTPTTKKAAPKKPATKAAATTKGKVA
jgi:hypothetical protein